MRALFLLAALVLVSLSASGERISDYFVAVTVSPGGYVEVAEVIAVSFDLPRHGIIREIPYSYRLSTGERFNLRIAVEDVRADGEKAPVKVARRGGRLILRIGDPDRYVEGTVAYLIRYRVERALRAYGDEVELYWNAIGTEWTMPIDKARVEVRLPEAIPADAIRYVAYQGPYGSTEAFPLTQEGNVLRGEATGLRPGEGIAVAVRFPKGYVELPGVGRKLLWFLSDNLYAGIPVLTLLGMFGIWWRWGRDPKKGTIPVEYAPPKEVHPAAAGVLVDDRLDPQDIVAGIISLATKGYLEIVEVGGDGEPEDYELRLLPKEGRLPRFERNLLRKLFKGRKEKTVRLSDLKYEFYEEVPALAAEIYMDLTEKGLYPANPDRVRNFYRTLGTVTVFLGLGLGIFAGSLYLGLSVGISGIIIYLFAPYMPRKTRKGMEVLRRVLGLEEYIRRAEKPYLEFAAAEKHFEELLPYAMAFGMVEKWAWKFEGLLKRPPSWYRGSFPSYSPYLFGTRLFLFHSVARDTFMARPRSAGGGWRGGSAFGGGGFSGGGMGGGGGSSW